MGRASSCHPEKPYFAKGQCRQCYLRAYRLAHTEQHRLYSKRSKERNKETAALTGKAYHLRKKYGLTPEQCEDMREAQGGKCAICANFMVKPQVDHNHTTGKVRGLLCGNCNRALGIFQDSSVLLRSAAEYLENNHG